jgi:peptidoglycan-N-acetylmuramic acid deacetylase
LIVIGILVSGANVGTAQTKASVGDGKEGGVQRGAVVTYAARQAQQQAPKKDGNGFNFGFYKSRGGDFPSIANEGFMEILQRQEAIFLGDTQQREVYLTFDNGYENGFTGQILDTLKTKKVPAAFFVTGHYLSDKPELVQRMVAEGHIVGNHSWNHPDMTTLSNSDMLEELTSVKEGVTAIVGPLQEMVYLRPPRGIFNEHVLAVAKRAGYTSVFWSIAYKDWEVDHQKGAQYAYDNVMSQLHPGAVILVHAVSKDNADALGRIIDDARAQGYIFKSLDEMKTRNYR